MTRSPSRCAAAIIALKSAVLPKLGSGGRKSGSLVSKPPSWKPTGWRSRGDGSSRSSAAQSRNGRSSGRFAFSSGASAYVRRLAPSLLCSDGYASMPLSCRYARIDCSVVSPTRTRTMGLVHVAPRLIHVWNSCTRQYDGPEHGAGVRSVQEAELHRVERPARDRIDGNVRVADVEREIVGERPARWIELHVVADAREERGCETNAREHGRRIACGDGGRVAGERFRELDAAQHVTPVLDPEAEVEEARLRVHSDNCVPESRAAVIERQCRRRGVPAIGEPSRRTRCERAAADVRAVAVGRRAPQAAARVPEERCPGPPVRAVDEPEDLAVALAQREAVRAGRDRKRRPAVGESDAGRWSSAPRRRRCEDDDCGCSRPKASTPARHRP